MMRAGETSRQLSMVVRAGRGRAGVKVKILAVVALGALVSLAIGLIGLSKLGSVRDNADAIYERGVRPVELLGLIRRETLMVRLDTTNHVVSQDDATMAANEKALEADDRELAERIEEYRQLSAATDVLAEMERAWAEYVKVRDTELVPLGRANKIEEWQRVRDAKSLPLVNQVTEHLAKLAEAESARAGGQRDAAQASYRSAQILVIAFLLIGISLSVGVGLLIATRITTPLQRVRDALKAMAEGDLTRRVEVRSTDEVGEMARALTEAQDGVADAIRQVTENAAGLADAATELDQMTVALAAAADQGTSQATSVAASAEEVSRNVSSVATAGSEMGASIQEIARNTSEATKVAGEAVQIAEDTSRTVTSLGESGRQIGEVVRLITSIADQTNLLALNATIEAARAGDAGKGFAVVANEVKELAQQTAQATGEIANRVETIQSDTEAAVAAITRIADVVARIDAFQTTIASAVEEQSATTSELGRNIEEASVGSTSIAETIQGIAAASGQTSTTAGDLREASSTMARMSEELRRLVGRFSV